MDKDFLEDYQAHEVASYYKLEKSLSDGTFDIEEDIYPQKERFTSGFKSPVVMACCQQREDIWAQIPFCGSVVIALPAFSAKVYEERYFKISEIPEIIQYSKETGKVQFVLESWPAAYRDLDFLEPILKELNPPCCFMLPPTFFTSKKELEKSFRVFDDLAKIYLEPMLQFSGKSNNEYLLDHLKSIYSCLKIIDQVLASEFEDKLIDNPLMAMELAELWGTVVLNPKMSLLSRTVNYDLELLQAAKEVVGAETSSPTFPNEIGKFLFRKLTYSPINMHGSQLLMDNYNAYDLQSVQDALNKAIIANCPTALEKESSEFSQILDNIWDDKTIPHRITGIRIGVPFLLAVIGAVVAGPVGLGGGFLTGLGYNVADQTISLHSEKISAKVGKFKSKSYQAFIYDFKQRYKEKMALEPINKRAAK